ncbi:MAG: hypothetical protein M3R55_03515 [Acidobacteriota bacterium]|nr:hypothetical protein [Acidobacteriota bacterium]
MALRVGLDMDGVLADFRAAFELVARSPEITAAGGDPSRSRAEALSNSEVKQVWARIQNTPNWWTTVTAFEPAQILRLYQMARKARWEVVFMTKRPMTTGEPVQFQTQHWLERHGFHYPAVVTVPGSRGELSNALKLDLIVDDQLYNCLDVVTGSHTKALLLQRDPDARSESQATARGIGVVRTLEEALDALQGFDGVQQERKGRIQRLTDWFQPKPPDTLPFTADASRVRLDPDPDPDPDPDQG